MVISVHPPLPARNLKELVALARARPGELTYATASVVGRQRMAMEMFKDIARIDVISVPYGGGALATTAVMGGHTSMLVANVAESASQIVAGRLRGIAVTNPQDRIRDCGVVAGAKSVIRPLAETRANQTKAPFPLENHRASGSRRS